ncbi:MAG: hypothetical protein V1904_03960 [Bacteroidota bacterium]
MRNPENKNKGRFAAYLKKNLVHIISVVLGIAGGYIYYSTVGCSSGSCAIVSNVWLSMALGAAAGYFIAGMIRLGNCGCNISNNPTCHKNEN